MALLLPKAMAMLECLTFSGRAFEARELELMRQLTREFSTLWVTGIARTVCELLEWKRPSGGLKNHECRQLLERLRDEGFLKLPELRKLGGRGPRRVDLSGACLKPAALECTASECEPLELDLVEGKAESRRWREQLERYHYLGCRVAFGANLRYWVRHRDRELACLLWTSPAWRMQTRDAWIGWSDEQRRRNLQRIVSNGRFLIVPGGRVKGLASKILALSAWQVPRDWNLRYGCRPLLWKPWWTRRAFAEPATGPPTGDTWDRPLDAAGWIGSTKLRGTPSKTFVFTLRFAMPGSGCAVIQRRHTAMPRGPNSWMPVVSLPV
jgi:hypothetical protein